MLKKKKTTQNIWVLYQYPHLSVPDSRSVLGQAQHVQVHVVLSAPPQAEAEAFVVSLQVHRVELCVLPETGNTRLQRVRLKSKGMLHRLNEHGRRDCVRASTGSVLGPEQDQLSAGRGKRCGWSESERTNGQPQPMPPSRPPNFLRREIDAIRGSHLHTRRWGGGDC